jgi:hypothetical protein
MIWMSKKKLNFENPFTIFFKKINNKVAFND